jgi:hypothetical protein
MKIPELVKQADQGLSTVGKSTQQIATQLTGYATGFREVSDKFGISPFDTRAVIDSIGKIEGQIQGEIKNWQKQIGAIGDQAMQYYSQVQSVAKSAGVKIDWLN